MSGMRDGFRAGPHGGACGRLRYRPATPPGTRPAPDLLGFDVIHRNEAANCGATLKRLAYTIAPRYDIHILCISKEVIMQVAKWGNSLAVRLPQAVVEALKLKEGDDIEITVAGMRKFEVGRDRRREEALGRLRALKRPLPSGFRFDRDEANER
jgi:antitoxin MazE